MSYRIVETDNFGGDYPAEVFVNLPGMGKEAAEKVAKSINDSVGGVYSPRFWKVVGEGYQLQPGFEP